MLRVFPSVDLLAKETLPGLTLLPELLTTAGLRATLCRFTMLLCFSESSALLLTLDSLPSVTWLMAAFEALRFWMPAFTMFLKLTVIGFDLRVLIERWCVEPS